MRRIFLFFVFLSVICVSHVFADQQRNMSVSANVPPRAADYQLSMVSTYDPAVSLIRQDTNLEYVITYGASSSAAFAATTTITADWRSSDAMTDIHILDYVTGSASKGYGGAAPVVDLADRSITWTIPSLPPGAMDQTVKFDLKTNSNYMGDGEIRFTVRANMHNQYATMDEQSVIKTFKYDPNPLPSNTTPTPTPVPQAPAPQIPDPRITNVALTGITSKTATVLLDTSKPVKAKILYGTTSRDLPQSVKTLEYSPRNFLTLDGLSPETNYYFRVLITSDNGREIASEIFTFKTAQSSTPPDLTDNIIVLTSGGNIILSDIQREKGTSLVALLTPDSDYELNYALRRPLALASIDAVVRNKVLGINNIAFAKEPQTIVIPMTEKSPSTYFASLKTLNPGLFEVYVRIIDTHGNIKEQKVAELKVMPYLSVFEEGNNQPVPDSRVFFSYYNMLSGKYEPLPREVFGNVQNPSYSIDTGAVRINLPPGRYRAVASAFGYAQKSVDFVLGPNSGEDFPTIYLRKDQTNIFNYVDYYTGAISDVVTNVTVSVNSIAGSVRFFNLLATFVLTVSIAVTFIFFSLRTRVYLRHILPYFTHHLRTITQQHPLGTFCATITDEQGKRIKGALISVLDDTTGELVTSIASNTVGICYLFNPQEHKNLKLLIIKEGYMPKTVAVESDIADTPEGLSIRLKKGTRPKYPVLANIWAIMGTTGGMLFEVSLFVSLILELIFLSVYGLSKTLPFFALSFFNLFLWILYQKEKQDRKVFKKT